MPTIIKSALALLLPREKRLLLLAVIIQSFLSLADILGIALVGAIGSLGFTYIAGLPLPNWVSGLLDFLGFGETTVQKALILVSILAAILFISKSLLTLILSKRIFAFLANRQSRIAAEAAKRIAQAPYIWIRKQNMQNLIYVITDGTNSIILGVIGNLIIIISELILLSLILTVLLLVNLQLALGSFFFFGGVAVIVGKVLGKYASRQGSIFSDTAMQGRNQVSAILLAYRELITLQRQETFLSGFEQNRKNNAESSASTFWMQQIPKTLAEITLVLGAGTLVAFQVWQNTANEGIGVLLLFLAAASRLTPSLMKLQGAFLYTKNYAAAGEITIKTLSELQNFKFAISANRPDYEIHKNGPAAIDLVGVEFRYPDGNESTVDGISFRIERGSISALAGSSGSGKTTLADLILGVFSPDAGEILFDSKPILSWKELNLGGLGYVPQSPFLLPGSLLENIALGVPREYIDMERILEVVRKCQLETFISNLPEGYETLVGNLGGRLSGGERQRIAIARALYPNPGVLVIDEGTSALDSQTEFEITKTLISLKGNTTVLLIAHRLASIKNVDEIFFISAGKLQAKGDFESLQKSSSQFAKQVNLMRLE